MTPELSRIEALAVMGKVHLTDGALPLNPATMEQKKHNGMQTFIRRGQQQNAIILQKRLSTDEAQDPVPKKNQMEIDAELDEISNFQLEQEARRKAETVYLLNRPRHPLPTLSESLAPFLFTGPREGSSNAEGSEGRLEESDTRPRSLAPAAPVRRLTCGKSKPRHTANVPAPTNRKAATAILERTEVNAADPRGGGDPGEAPATSTYDRRARPRLPSPYPCPHREPGDDPSEADHNVSEFDDPERLEVSPYNNGVVDDVPVGQHANSRVLGTILHVLRVLFCAGFPGLFSRNKP